MNPITELNRRLAGTTQKRLAEELGVSATYLNDVLHGRREPGDAILSALGLVREVRHVRAK
jgi:transcriptional regulator with XRE-family HTH domain